MTYVSAGKILSTLALVLLGGAPAIAQDVVKIGYSGPLSGGAAQYGKNVLNGMEMAAAEINAAGLEVGGRKYKLAIVALDDKYNPSETAINAQHQSTSADPTDGELPRMLETV